MPNHVGAKFSSDLTLYLIYMMPKLHCQYAEQSRRRYCRRAICVIRATNLDTMQANGTLCAQQKLNKIYGLTGSVSVTTLECLKCTCKQASRLTLWWAACYPPHSVEAQHMSGTQHPVSEQHRITTHGRQMLFSKDELLMQLLMRCWWQGLVLVTSRSPEPHQHLRQGWHCNMPSDCTGHGSACSRPCSASTTAGSLHPATPAQHPLCRNMRPWRREVS